MANFEDAIQKTGWGLFHQFIMGMSSACAFAQAMGQLSIPFAIPLAACDISMSESHVLYINMCLSFGMAIGGVLFSGAADVIGRKCMISTTLILIFSSNFACGFSHGYAMILVCTFILGSGLTSNANCVKILLAELLPISGRGKNLIVPDILWAVGYIVFSMICWGLTPTILKNYQSEMRMTTWRLIYGISGALSIMIACSTALLVPSPRILLYNKKFSETVNVLKHIYAINNSKHCETFNLDEEQLSHVIDDFHMNNNPFPSNCSEQIVYILRRIKNATVIIFNKRFVRLTIILLLMKLAMLMSILMTNIWLSKTLYYGEEEHCNINGIKILHLEERTLKPKCSFKPSYVMYRDFFLIAFSILFGKLLLLFMIERFGRRFSIIFGCIFCGISSLSLVYIKNAYEVRLVMSSIFMMFYSLTTSALDIMTIESYPTAIRGTAAGETQFFAHIAGGLLKKFLQMPCYCSFIFVGTLMLGATALAYFLPDYSNRPMVE